MTREETIEILESYKNIEDNRVEDMLRLGFDDSKESQKRKDALDRAILAMRAIDEAQVIIKAFKSSLESINERLEELEQESEILELDLQDGERGVGITRKCFEVRVKKKLLRDILCFMTQALEDAKEGSEE